MSDELTVEEALKELREMFPDETFLHVGHVARWSTMYGDEREATIQIQGTGFRAKVLTEAMAQVRAFKQSQAKEQEIRSNQ